MRAFFTYQLDNNEDLHAQLKRTESDLDGAQKTISDGGRLLKEIEEEREVAKAKARRMGEEKEVAKAKCKDMEQEKDHLRKDLEELQVASNIQKKELEELRAGFAVEKEELKEDYQKQVDEMFFFGYQCYMRKNDITHDTPNYLYDEEDATVSGPAQGDKDSDAVGPFDGQ